MRAYKLEVGKDIELVEIDNDLKILRDFVDGHIEAITIAPNTFMICNEDGKYMDLPLNFVIVNENGQVVDEVVGNVLFVGFDGVEDFDDITDIGMNLFLSKMRLCR